jgi:hypothetical protein
MRYRMFPYSGHGDIAYYDDERYGRKTRLGGSSHYSIRKRQARRWMKRRARLEGKAFIQEFLLEGLD